MEWAKHNILINYVQTGAADIPEFHAYRKTHAEHVDHLIENLAIPRLADPVEDIEAYRARARAFLASQAPPDQMPTSTESLFSKPRTPCTRSA